MKISLRAFEAPSLLDRLPAEVTTLSLDCFDTLLWRAVQAPSDVFSGIEVAGGAVKPRIMAEHTARRIAISRGRSETSLEEIYRTLMPDAADSAIQAAIEHELALEARYCFAFAPVVELMRAAKARGLHIILVSDMYLSETQLRTLLAATAGEDVLALIDRIFMSSAYGCGKRETLFLHVLETLRCRPGQLFHLGDNRQADVERPAQLGLHVAHLVQFDPATEQRLRLEANAALLIDPATRIGEPVAQPHRAQIATRRNDDPAYALGYDVIGSTLHTFVHWLKAELDEMAERVGKPVRPLFMMRDGHLPYLAFDRLFPEMGGRPVEISRIVAVRASLYDQKALDDYLDRSLGFQKIGRLRRQLMLSQEEVRAFGCTGANEEADRERFAAAIRDPRNQRKIIERARHFGAKFAAHLEAADIRRGDSVMLVDIGYNGTVQNMIEPFLAEHMGLTVAGRYLFLREIEQRRFDKRGMIDTRNYEWRTLDALARCVGFLELLWNNGEGSTVDLTVKGKPIREATDAKARQSAIRDTVQAAALDFVEQSGQGAFRAPWSDDANARRRLVANSLARLFFLPTKTETKLFASFNYDLNMGAGKSIKLFDPDAASVGLRQRGLCYVSGAQRMYVPAEIQSHGLPLNLTHFASLRYALDLHNGDFAVGGIKVPAIIMGGSGQTMIELDAYPTSDGYYRVIAPLGTGGLMVALQFGRICEWLQVGDSQIVTLEDLGKDELPEEPKDAELIADGMTTHAPNLFSLDPHGLLAVPPLKDSIVPMALELSFRPIQWRKEQADASALAEAA